MWSKIRENEKTLYVLNEEQKSKNWKKSKNGRVTASIANIARGQSRFKTDVTLANELCLITKPIYTSEAMTRINHGVNTENEALLYLEKITGFKITEQSLTVPEDEEILGFSPDGMINLSNGNNLQISNRENLEGDGMIEIKCPGEMYRPLKSFVSMKSLGIYTPEKTYHEHIYDSHYDQIQLSLYISGRKWCIYFVYINEEEYYKEIVHHNDEYIEKLLLPGLYDFIANLLLPRLKKFRLSIETPNDFDIDSLIEKYSIYKNK